jgi:hypothetical protein
MQQDSLQTRLQDLKIVFERALIDDTSIDDLMVLRTRIREVEYMVHDRIRLGKPNLNPKEETCQHVFYRT